MSRKNLILIYRGADYERDFREIAEKVRALDPNIFTAHLFAGANKVISDADWAYPTLTVSTCRGYVFSIKRGPVLRCQAIDKLDQQQTFRANGIPTPQAAAFEFGMTLDPIAFGDFVILKPRDPMLMSQGVGVHVYRRARAVALKPTDFPVDHPINWNKKGYLIQRFIYTGAHPITYRVTTFFGEPILAFYTRANDPSPPLSAPDEVIEAGDYTPKHNRSTPLEADQESVALSKGVAAAFGDIPLLGIDFIREHGTGKMFVLEVNAGGNTWHFSSPAWAARRAREPYVLDDMKRQFFAFDTVARVLVEKVHALAS